jgi:hypothetical protein
MKTKMPGTMILCPAILIGAPLARERAGSRGPEATHDSTIFIDVRYTLPGSMPAF